MTIWTRLFSVLLPLLLITPPSLAQSGNTPSQTVQKGEKLGSIEAIIADFIDNIAARKFEEAALSMKILGDPYDGEQFKRTILSLDIIGKPFYSDKLIDKQYGSSGKDIVYKITTDNNVYFFRFILHKRTADNWIITWLGIQSELQAPLPKIWNHITP